MNYSTIKTSCLLLILFISACNKKDAAPANKITTSNEKVTLNPTGYSPLAATIYLETSISIKITVRVAGKHGAGSDIVKDFSDFDKKHTIPVLGLYPDFENTVELIFKNSSGAEVGRKTFLIKTSTLPADTYPAIVINKKTDQMAEGMTLLSYFGYNSNPTPQTPFLFDAFGDIRWYLDFKTSPQLKDLFYDDGMELLQNGNLYFGDGNSNKIYEIDFFGAIINAWEIPGFRFHHEVHEKPNGNFIVTVNKDGMNTIEDYIIEIDRNTKQIIKVWDLNLSLQNNRFTLLNNPTDWIHVNALTYDPSDNTIIISGRTQGIIKLDQDNKVKWILGCHKGWGTSGNGVDLKNFLLQPLDAANQPITNQNILDGNINHADFEWNWYQHAPLLMPNGNLMLFDNGWNNRNFSGSGQYSRAVEYNVNSTNKTVKQVWEFGKSNGGSTLAPIVSDVDYLVASNHVIFSPGSVNYGTAYGKVIEVDYTTKNVVFEATLTPPHPFFGITFHRTERIKLYP